MQSVLHFKKGIPEEGGGVVSYASLCTSPVTHTSEFKFGEDHA
jgi:hypothetical protein